MKTKLILIIIALFTLQSCTTNTPEEYFSRTTLNINKYIHLGSQDFQSMIEKNDQDAMYAKVDGKFIPNNNFEAHVKTLKIYELEKDIELVNNLTVTDETKDLIKASLNIMNFVKSKYETEYAEIAKLMDQKIDDKAINAMKNFDLKIVDEFTEKINTLHKIAIPYAEANGITVNTF